MPLRPSMVLRQVHPTVPHIKRCIFLHPIELPARPHVRFAARAEAHLPEPRHPPPVTPQRYRDPAPFPFQRPLANVTLLPPPPRRRRAEPGAVRPPPAISLPATLRKLI